MTERPDPANDSVEAVEGLPAYSRVATELIGAARLQVAILSHALDARVYGDAAFIEQARRFCLQHERATLRVLVNQPGLSVREANRFIELGRRLPSRIQFRELDEQDRGVVEELLICDERSVLHKERYDALEARCHRHAPLEARLRLKDFNLLWDRSLPAREFSELRI